MKLIDEYLDTLYKKDNNKSTLELKQEMRDHLIESVNDLKLQGLNDEEACKKAIEKSLNFGEKGLPKIGSGDWNDGFSTVGNKGKGESIWLGFFLSDILKKFIPICQYKGEEKLAKKYEDIMNQLKKSLNTNGWDGRWFRRAFTDNGETLRKLAK